jgi:hypothetical protein
MKREKYESLVYLAEIFQSLERKDNIKISAFKWYFALIW